MSGDAPGARPAPAWLPWIVGVVWAALGAFLTARLHAGEILSGLSDEALLLPLALRSHDGGLFEGDRWLLPAADVFSKTYSALVGPVVANVDDPLAALRWIAVVFQTLFLAGVFRLASDLGGKRAGHLAVAVLALAPLLVDPALVAAGGASWPRMTTAIQQVTLAHGAALPRDLVFAFFPWIWVMYRSLRGRAPGYGILPFLLTGILANLHPLTAAHLAGLLALVAWLEDRSRVGLATGLAGLAAFLVGAFPYVIQFTQIPATPGRAAQDVLDWRIGTLGGEGLTAWAERMEPLIWGLVACTALLRMVKPAREAPVREAVTVAWAAAVITGLGPVLESFVEPLAALQSGRVVRFGAVAALIGATGLATPGLGTTAYADRRTRLAGIVAACCLGIVILVPSLISLTVGGPAKRGLLGRIARKVERGREVPATTPLPEGLVRRFPVGEATPLEGVAAQKAFVTICDHAREHTPENTLFLVPPEDWGAFRAYARRAVIVTRKEGSYALAFLGGGGAEWYAEYAAVVKVYASAEPAEWTYLATKTGADYAVVEAGATTPVEWESVLESGPYRLLRIP